MVNFQERPGLSQKVGALQNFPCPPWMPNLASATSPMVTVGVARGAAAPGADLGGAKMNTVFIFFYEFLQNFRIF